MRIVIETWETWHDGEDDHWVRRVLPEGSLVISKENGDRFVELLSQAMGHLSVAIGDVARSGSDQSKRMVINAADQKVAEVWSALRALAEGVPARSEDVNDEGDDDQNANHRPDEVASLHETKIADEQAMAEADYQRLIQSGHHLPDDK